VFKNHGILCNIDKACIHKSIANSAVLAPAFLNSSFLPWSAGYDVKVASMKGGPVPFDPASLTAKYKSDIVNRFFDDGAESKDIHSEKYRHTCFLG